MKQLYEFDQITTPEDWMKQALNIEKSRQIDTEQKNTKNKKKLAKVLGISNRVMKFAIAAGLILVIAGASTITYFAKAYRDYTMTPEEEQINEKPFVLMLTGSDSSPKLLMESDRSDANLLIAVNPKTKQLAVVSTDRDAYVKLPQTDDNLAGYDKLCHAGLEGTEVQKSVMKDLYGVDVDYVSKVDFDGVKELIDQIGGISVYSDENFTTGQDASPVPYTFSQGYNECNGEMALAFCRERHAFAEGNVARSNNQVYVLEAVIKKLSSPDVIGDYNAVTKVIGDMMLTDMTKETMIALIKGQVNCLSEWNCKTMSVTGKYTSKNLQVFGMSNVAVTILDENSVNEASNLIKDVLDETE